MSQKDFFRIKIAGLLVGIEHKHSYVRELCRDFTASDEYTDMLAFASDAEIRKENEQYEKPFPDAYCEGICIYRSIAEKLPDFDAFVFHGAAVEIDGRGFVFAAPSGTGKSTHISLLLKNYPENVHIINGDKPIIRYFPSNDGKCDGEWRVCSTPWAGKEDMKVNTTAPLCGVILLSRGIENKIERAVPREHFSAIMHQVYIPEGAMPRMTTLELVDKLSKAVQFYHLECNISSNAAEVSYNALKK